MKIKQLKIINQDESTEIADIGADAVNIDYNDTNVKLKLDELSNDNNRSKNNITDLQTELNTTNSNLDLQTSRIDNLAHLEEGSTTGDAELIDARISNNGKNYNSLGTHIRTLENDSLLKDKSSKISQYGSSLDLFSGLVGIWRRSVIDAPVNYYENTMTVPANGYCFWTVSQTDLRSWVTPYLPVEELKNYEYVSFSFKADNLNRESIRIVLADNENGTGTIADGHILYETAMNYDSETETFYGRFPLKYISNDHAYQWIVWRIDNRNSALDWNLTNIFITLGYPGNKDIAYSDINFIPAPGTFLKFDTVNKRVIIPEGEFVSKNGCIHSKLTQTTTASYAHLIDQNYSSHLMLICNLSIQSRNQIEVSVIPSTIRAGIGRFILNKSYYRICDFWVNDLKSDFSTNYMLPYEVDGFKYNYSLNEGKQIWSKINSAYKYEDLEKSIQKEKTTIVDDIITIQPTGYCFIRYKLTFDPCPYKFYFAVKVDIDNGAIPENIEVAPKRAGDNDEAVSPAMTRLFPMSNKPEWYIGEFDINMKTLQYEPNEYSHVSLRLDNRRTTTEKNLIIEEIKIVQEKTGFPSLDIPVVEENFKTYYVAVNGNDTNSGLSRSTALATINQALSKGAANIIVMPGIYTNQTIDASLAKNPHIDIRLDEQNNGKAIFNPGTSRIIGTTENQVEGYTNVYSIQSTNYLNSYRWIIQSNVIEESTLISDEERHPCQRGMHYRCEDTRIIKTNNTSLSSALNEIENSNEYKFFYDETNAIYYYSRPQTVDDSHPLCILGSANWINNTSRKHSLNITGIELDGYCMSLLSVANSIITDCKVRNVNAGGAYRYDRSLNSTFIRCEAQHVQSGSNGDGFNGHSQTTGEWDGKQTTCSLIDCWAHDIFDDGYSDHERSEITIRGGLYEYCGKGGITPSYGSHCSCFDVYSRKNYAGFYYTGNATEAEGGAYGQLICYNCVAENNTRGGQQAGYRVDGQGNKAILINCKSIGNTYGYSLDSNGYKMVLIDCSTLNDTNVKKGYASNFEVKNTTLITTLE